MNIRTILGLKPHISAKNADKLVTLASDTIPGKSYEQISALKKDIAIFAREHKIKNVEIYDARRDLKNDEFVSPSLENKFGGYVAMNLKHKDGTINHDYVDYFKNKDNFMGAFFEKMASMSQFFTKEVKPEFKIEKAALGNMSPKAIQKLEAKALKPAGKMKISNIEILESSSGGAELKLKRVYDENSWSSETSYFKKGTLTAKEVVAKIKGFDAN